jgi:hypothetical protein
LQTLKCVTVCADFCAERIQIARKAPGLDPRAALDVESVDRPIFAPRTRQSQQRVSWLCDPPVEYASITEAAFASEAAHVTESTPAAKATKLAEAASPVELAAHTEARETAEIAMVAEGAIRIEHAPLGKAAIAAKASLRVEKTPLAERTPLAEIALDGEIAPLTEAATCAEDAMVAEATTCAKNARRAETAPLAENASLGEYAPIAEGAHCRVVASRALPKPINYRQRIKFRLCKCFHLVFPHLGSAPSSSRPPCLRAVSHARSQRRRMAGSAHSRRAMRRSSTSV